MINVLRWLLQLMRYWVRKIVNSLLECPMSTRTFDQHGTNFALAAQQMSVCKSIPRYSYLFGYSRELWVLSLSTLNPNIILNLSLTNFIFWSNSYTGMRIFSTQNKFLYIILHSYNIEYHFIQVKIKVYIYIYIFFLSVRRGRGKM